MSEIVYIDGACSNNGRAEASAGIGVYFGENDPRNVSRSLSPGRQTNQRAVLMAAIDAVQVSDRHIPLVVKSNSVYVVKGMNKWIKRWEKNGYKTVKGKPVVNADLFKELKKKCQSHGSVEFSFLKSTQDFYGESCADALAKAGAKLKRESHPTKASSNNHLCPSSDSEPSTTLFNSKQGRAKHLSIYKTKEDGSLVLVMIVQAKDLKQFRSNRSQA